MSPSGMRISIFIYLKVTDLPMFLRCNLVLGFGWWFVAQSQFFITSALWS
jgi:hypothetical protein